MPFNAMELDDAKHELITRHCAAGDEFANLGQHEKALSEYNNAWKIIPEPKNNWEASTWTLAAIADSCFSLGNLQPARKALEYAMTCPGAIGNPFLHLRLGQILFDLGEVDSASDELMRAYMGAGDKIFLREDPKYLAHLKKSAAL